MSKLLKDQIDQESINKLALLIQQQQAEFKVVEFTQCVLDEKWSGLSLKQRVRQISNCLNSYLHGSYLQQLATLRAVSVHFSGLFHFVFADFVECYGLHSFEESMQALALFTENSTAEFAVQVFLDNYPEQTRAQLLVWARSDNEHLRRLASEGVRPKLPWSKHLPWIAENPEWIKPIIDCLQADPSPYVRKSVANLLNDLSKEQAEWVLNLFSQWKKQTPMPAESRWIMKHALRTLLKRGDERALQLVGYSGIAHVKLDRWQLDNTVAMGNKLHFSFQLHAKQSLGLLRVEYALYFLRKQQQAHRKVFKIAESDYSASEKSFNKSHDFKKITTRQYQPGEHLLELIINGQVVKSDQFTLL